VDRNCAFFDFAQNEAVFLMPSPIDLMLSEVEARIGRVAAFQRQMRTAVVVNPKAVEANDAAMVLKMGR
jgi:hypothetical protein